MCVDVDTKRFGWVRVLRAALKSCELDFFCAGFDLLFLMGNIWPTARSAGAMYVQLICSACRVHFYLGELTFFLDFVELLLILRRDQSGKLAVLIGTN